MKVSEAVNQDEIINKFRQLETLADVASILGFSTQTLSFVLYGAPFGRDSWYSEYSIPKKSGGSRLISAPANPLLFLQKKLTSVLQQVYVARPSAHAFLPRKSIRSNAKAHIKKRFVLNIDLEDFFGSINFGRVRGLFIAHPYSLPPKVATILAQIICHKGALPQGGATSPIVSNMICSRLDGDLQRFAKREKCTYTRYADDITFSTNLKTFPEAIYLEQAKIISVELKEILKRNGFKLNQGKVRLQSRELRQEVTGLVVNKRVNVKREYLRAVRGALHAWEHYGYELAEKTFHEKYYPRTSSAPPNLRDVLRGQIAFIHRVNQDDKTHNSVAHLKLLEKYHLNLLRDSQLPIIRTEGKTDWMHMRRALAHLKSQGRCEVLSLKFFQSKEAVLFGDGQLMKFCELAKNGVIRPFKAPVICLFDNDSKDAMNRHKNSEVVSWGANVFSTLIKRPPDEFDTPAEFSIEHLYKKTDLMAKIEGRRFYFGEEFGPDCRLKSNPNIYFHGNIASRLDKVIDNHVYEYGSNKKLALSKARFARAVFTAEESTKHFTFDGFIPLFDHLQTIVANTLTGNK